MRVIYAGGVFEELVNLSYLVFYVPTESGIKILHVLHSATDYNRAFEDE